MRELAQLGLVMLIGGIIGIALAKMTILPVAPAPAAPVPSTQRECPPTYDGRILARQVYKAPDRQESVLACFYAAPKKP